MAITPPTYTPSGSLLPAKAAVTPYTYGNLPTTTSAYNIWGSTGNPYLRAGPTYTPGAGAPVVPVPVTPTAPIAQPGDSGGSDYSDSDTTSSPYGLQDHLGDYYNRPAWTRAIPGVSSIYGITDLARGINPLNFTGLVGDGNQTFDWYEGDTDYFGNPITNKFSNVLDNGAGSQTELDVTNKYGWGSDEHFNSLDMDLLGGSGGGKVYTGPMLNPWGSAQDPIAIQAQQAIVTDKAEKAANKAAIEAANAPVTYSQPVTFGSVANPIDGVTYGGVDPANNYSAGTVSSASSGDVGYNDYGGGYYGFDDNGTEVGWEDPDGSDGGGPSGDSSYIATAATQALGEEGLTVFNNWRDHMRNVVPEFTVSFGRYRVTAPKIVAEIDTKEDSKRIYKDIWDKHLKPIYDLIVADRDSVKAQDDYRIMVRELMNKYLKGDK
jgi:hypothetical protein